MSEYTIDFKKNKILAEILSKKISKEDIFFNIPHSYANTDKNKKDRYSKVEKERRPYVPRTELAGRSDAGFYQTFYAGDAIGIFADYDDVVAQFIKRNPNVELKFDSNIGTVEAERGTVLPSELNGFIQAALQYGVPASTFDPKGSIKRVEERQWFRTLSSINLTSRKTTLEDLRSSGLLQSAVPGVSQQEISINTLDDAHKRSLKKFYRERQHFWHPDVWSLSQDLTKKQRQRINEMSAKINRLSIFV